MVQLPNTKDYRSSDRIVSDAHGWGTIHVFYGEASAIFGDDTSQQFFAQVKQDEIVLDLMRDITDRSKVKSQDEHPFFFIDLAANDAKTLSNTLALEQRGWQGLCIEPNPAY
ncbi:hypothetical protein MPSEU_001054700 [Mayamaea pseudoterrestris]|nr:hypothetical protein MPSEU_001054700 [Mayamaea pseudoterrestris]